MLQGGTPRIIEVTGGPEAWVVWELRVGSWMYRATRIADFR
ncbi:MAG TPA: hypothetical protein VMK65_09645 [Longimicrobiales bacterium]|nr:hypothetical protein [Longimicrobiales bacterium]